MWRPRRTNDDRPNFEKILNENIVDPIKPYNGIKSQRKDIRGSKRPLEKKVVNFEFNNTKDTLKFQKTPTYTTRGTKVIERLTTTRGSNLIYKISTQLKYQMKK